MRRIIAVLLVLTMVLALCACGSDAEAKPSNNVSSVETGSSVLKPNAKTAPRVWEEAFYLDNFNQPTKKSYIGTIDHLKGTFNSTTVTDGQMEAEIRVDGSIISILLYENGNEKVKNGGNKDILFPIEVMKPDGSTFSINGVMLVGEDCIKIQETQANCVLIGSDTEKNRTTSIATALCTENSQVTFYITREDQPATSYLFSADCGNFKEIYDDTIAKTIQELAYFYAEDFLRNGQLNEALNMFTALGTYSDSADRAQAVLDEINAGLETQYKAAEALADEGRYGLAAIKFWNINEYKDARDRSLELWGKATGRKTIAAGGCHSVAVKTDGTVVATGYGDDGQKRVSSWSNIIAVDGSFWNTIGLRANGTVVATGQNGFGQCDVTKWKDIVAIASGLCGTLGLKADGTVVVATNSSTGWGKSIAKWPGNIVSIAGGDMLIGLKSDGTVVAVDSTNRGMEKRLAEWRDIVAIASGGGGIMVCHAVGLKADGTVVAVGDNDDGQCNVSGWTDIIAIAAGVSHTVGLKSDGTVVAVGNNRDGRCNVSDWRDIVAISAGAQHTIGLKADGTMVATGYNGDGDGQCNVSGWSDIMLPNS